MYSSQVPLLLMHTNAMHMLSQVQLLLQDTRLSESSTSSSSPIRPNQALPSLAAKRKAACEFIKASTGLAPPYATDQAFRAALKDGVLLCKLANTVWPGIVKQVSNCIT